MSRSWWEREREIGNRQNAECWRVNLNEVLKSENNFATIAVKIASGKNDPMAIEWREKVLWGLGYLYGLQVPSHTLHISCRRKNSDNQCRTQTAFWVMKICPYEDRWMSHISGYDIWVVFQPGMQPPHWILRKPQANSKWTSRISIFYLIKQRNYILSKCQCPKGQRNAPDQRRLDRWWLSTVLGSRTWLASD